MLYRTLIILSVAFFRLRTQIRGIENLPKNEGFIIAYNHPSSLDQFIIASAMNGFLWKFLRKGKKIFFIGETRIKKRLYSFFLREKHGYISISPGVIEKAIELLKQGNIVAIVPEGGRVRHNSQKNKIRNGVGYMAHVSGIAVVPVYCGAPATFSFAKGSETFFKLKKIFKVYFGVPMNFSRISSSDLRKNRSIANSIAKRIIQEIYLLREKFQS